MDDRQNKLLIAAIAVIVLAGVIWFIFGKGGPKSGVSDLPENKANGPRQPMGAGGGPGVPGPSSGAPPTAE